MENTLWAKWPSSQVARGRGIAALFVLVVVISAAVPAHAAMQLSNVIVHFEPGEAARQDIEIANTAQDPLYVAIEPNLILSPGTEQEDRSPIADPREAGLLVTPNKLVIPAGATKVVRLVKLGNSPEERIFRIVAKPVTGGLEAESSGLKVMIGYEILAIVYPNNKQPSLEVERNGKMLHVRNSGNTNVLLREGYQCQSKDMPLDQCTALPGKRMYPGNEWQVELPYDLPVTYYQSIGMRNFVEEYP